MNLLKILQLPRWVLTDVQTSFNDSESMTTLEQTARLYGKMKELIDSYNAWVEETNRLIEEYKNEEDNQDECFENRIIETMNNYIASVDEKMACQEREFDEVRGLIDDLNANIKVEVETATRSIIETMKQSGEFNDLILSTLDEVNDRLSAYEQEINQKFTNLQAEVQAELDSLSNFAGDLNTLKSDVATLKEDNTKNKNDILTNQTNYYNLDATVDSLVTDNQTNKNDIEQNKKDIQTLNNELDSLGSGGWINATLNEEYLNEGCIVKYKKIGKLVVVDFEDVRVKKAVPTDIVTLITGLPTAVNQAMFILTPFPEGRFRMCLETSGKITSWFCGVEPSDTTYYYGQLIYLTH